MILNRSIRRCAFALGIAVLTACGPADIGSDVLRGIEEGTPRDAALSALGQGPLDATGHDTMRVVNGFRRQMFFVDGTNYEVIYFRRDTGSIDDPISRTTETPLVLIDGKVAGQGWQYYSDLAPKANLPLPSQPQ